MNSFTPQKSSPENPVPENPKIKFVEIGQAQQNQRLDNFLFKTLKRVPKTRIYRIIRKGEVRVNKKRCKPDYKLKVGDLIRIPPIRQEQTDSPAIFIADRLMSDIEQAVLFENTHLIVINKPSGLAVHTGSGISYGVIDIVRRMRPDSQVELVHRLDRDTSGCLILAKHRPALLQMQHCLHERTLKKLYTAVVKGCWPEHKRKVSYALSKKVLGNGERRVYVDPQGKATLTRVDEISAGAEYSFLTLALVTGRTHQIRVHCQAQGHEIAGDDKYGDSAFNTLMKQHGVNRLMLHAHKIELPQSEFSEKIVIEAGLPHSFTGLKF